MGIFGKSDDYLDIPALQKKGLVKLPEPKVDKSMKMNADGYVEIMDNELNQDSITPTSDSSVNSNPMAGFFDNSSTPQAPAMPNTNNTFQSFWDTPVNSPSSTTAPSSYFDNSQSTNSSNYSGNDIEALKTKIEGIEQKLDRILERLRY